MLCIKTRSLLVATALQAKEVTMDETYYARFRIPELNTPLPYVNIKTLQNSVLNINSTKYMNCLWFLLNQVINLLKSVNIVREG